MVPATLNLQRPHDPSARSSIFSATRQRPINGTHSRRTQHILLLPLCLVVEGVWWKDQQFVRRCCSVDGHRWSREWDWWLVEVDLSSKGTVGRQVDGGCVYVQMPACLPAIAYLLLWPRRRRRRRVRSDGRTDGGWRGVESLESGTQDSIIIILQIIYKGTDFQWKRQIVYWN